jgi:alpha-L-rhamnosidase
VQVTRLRCEHREDIPCIDGEAPRLSWMLEAEGRDRRQSAYRILVATSEEDLAAENGTLWDSGRVASSRTVDIAYAGLVLPRASEVAWTVQVWDESGAASDWAPPGRFRTALEDWSADWIRRDETEANDFVLEEPTDYVDPDEELFRLPAATYLRRRFAIDAPVRRATLYATARGAVELELNGIRVGDELLAPGWTDYDKRIEYILHDVTELVRDGENALGAILADGWYAGRIGFDPKQIAGWYGREPQLLCELHVECADGSVLVRSDGRWRATNKGPIQYSDLLAGERYDARLELGAWSEPGYDDSSWDPVVAEARDAVPLVPARAQPIRETQELRPVSVTERAPGVHVFDLGQNMVGWVRLTLEDKPGTRVELRFGEMLEADGSVYRENLFRARATDIFLAAGRGVETFEPRFTFHGFRYVEATGLENPTEETITGCVVHSDAPESGQFACSHELVNQLQRNITWGQRGNFLSVPTDCPQRSERLGWTADAQVFLPTASLNMDVAAFMTKWGDDLLDGQSPEGGYPDVAPRLIVRHDGAPAWADAGIIVPWTLYRRYGDRRLVERHWPPMERYMAYLQRHNPDLLWKRRRLRDYGDWLSIGERTPKELLATAYWAWDATLMARMARVLERDERAAFYERLRDGIATAFNAAYVEDDGTIEGDTQTGYLLALAFDLLPQELRPAAAERLVANIERRAWHLATGFIGVGLLCPVLTQTGYADVAHRLLLQETFPSWLYPIHQGATTIWERWDGWTEEKGFQSKNMNSFNHYSLGSVGAWLIEGVGGIRTDEQRVAYEHVVIEPVPGELTSARASYRSVRGEIVSDWKRDGEHFALDVTIPPNVGATVIVPAGNGSLTEDGAAAAQADGVHAVVRDGDAWRLEVGSGTYRFKSA